MNICKSGKKMGCKASSPMPEHRLCRLGEFMLDDFHQQEKGDAILSIFIILQYAATKNWLFITKVCAPISFVAALTEDILSIFS